MDGLVVQKELRTWIYCTSQIPCKLFSQSTLRGDWTHSWGALVRSCQGYLDSMIELQWKERLQFSHSVMSDSLQPHRLQHGRLPCPSPTPWACSNWCPSSWWCHPSISFSVIPLPSHLQPFPALGSFPMSQFFASSGWSIGASASVLPMSIQDWFPLGWTGWISLQFKRLSSLLLQHHSSKASILWCSAFFMVQLSHPYMTTRKTIALTRWDLCQVTKERKT